MRFGKKAYISPTLISYLEYLTLILLCVSGAGPVIHHFKLVVGEVGQEGRHISIKVPKTNFPRLADNDQIHFSLAILFT